jgi:hypothetical protein
LGRSEEAITVYDAMVERFEDSSELSLQVSIQMKSPVDGDGQKQNMTVSPAAYPVTGFHSDEIPC